MEQLIPVPACRRCGHTLRHDWQREMGYCDAVCRDSHPRPKQTTVYLVWYLGYGGDGEELVIVFTKQDAAAAWIAAQNGPKFRYRIDPVVTGKPVEEQGF